MKIVLLRHGKPLLTQDRSIKSRNMQHWIDAYNSAKLDPVAQPSAALYKISKQCQHIICSNLPRSIHSAKYLKLNTINESCPLFRELGLPYRKIPIIKLKPKLWAGLFRLFWFMGFSLNSESYQDAKIRAGDAAKKLIEIAHSKESVLVVGHGMLNRFIAKELLNSGWSCSQKLGNQHWDYGVFEKTV